MVEIDHGAGIKTRYGHLSNIKVKTGETVAFGEKIGVIGSTGRSTGNHLHYEILFMDKAIDPMKFIKAGRYVFKE
ncbi:MAG: M23 family metallopeptidase, partial [Alphaproteobacteria bacterium]|nr:M23 family metallopeptidase [Alphaproteobacteria bacterium]